MEAFRFPSTIKNYYRSDGELLRRPLKTIPMSSRARLKEIWDFLKVRKKYWLWPIIVMLALFGALWLFTSGPSLAPFIYGN